jgi:phosphoglycolate phosphatase-like HAD superfamily hydrolase
VHENHGRSRATSPESDLCAVVRQDGHQDGCVRVRAIYRDHGWPLSALLRTPAYKGAPEAAFHVGDTYDADVAGARAAGITPILLDSLGCEERTCDYRIASLRDVLAVLDRLD